MEISGLEGPIRIVPAVARASSTAGLGAPVGLPDLEPLDRPGGSVADHELLKGAPAVGCPHPGADLIVTGRQHRRPQADCRTQRRERLRRGVARTEHPGPLQAPCEVAVAEVEPHLDPERSQGIHDGEAVIAQAPAALIDQAGEPEADEVRVG